MKINKTTIFGSRGDSIAEKGGKEKESNKDRIINWNNIKQDSQSYVSILDQQQHERTNK